MPILTLETIRENPWNAVYHLPPPKFDLMLLKAALAAADYCRSSEFAFTVAAREGRYKSPGWDAPRNTSPYWQDEFGMYEPYEEAERRWRHASCRYMLLLAAGRGKQDHCPDAYEEAYL